jgi:hypothetical protein
MPKCPPFPTNDEDRINTEQKPMNAATTDTTRFFPSTAAAVVAGAIGMPLLVFGLRFIDVTFHSQLLMFLWGVVAFFVPVLLATGDLRYVARMRRESGSFFRPVTSAEDLRLFYIPAWKRGFVWFISAVISLLFLKAIGVEF